MNKLLALADRVEKLTGPDREVDAEIAEAVLGGHIAWRQSVGTMESYPVLYYASSRHAGGGGCEPIQSYTASLDAAKTLVPNEWGWQLSQTGVAGAWLISDGEQPITVDGLTFPGVTAQVGAKAISPELALTCAALRARAHGGGEGWAAFKCFVVSAVQPSSKGGAIARHRQDQSLIWSSANTAGPIWLVLKPDNMTAKQH